MKMHGELLDVKKVLEAWDPFSVWGPKVTKASIRKALATESLTEHVAPESRTRAYHARRIAYLVKHGWDDPISVDVGCGPFGGHFDVDDGNHRLCAAVLRGDASIKASTAGLVDIIKHYEYRP